MKDLQLIDFSEDITLCKSSGKYVFPARCCTSLSACQSIGMKAYLLLFPLALLLHRFSTVFSRCAESPLKVSRLCSLQSL